MGEVAACLIDHGYAVERGERKDKAAMLVILAGLRDGHKLVLAVESGHREPTES